MLRLLWIKLQRPVQRHWMERSTFHTVKHLQPLVVRSHTFTTSDVLPVGLTLNTNGVLSGTTVTPVSNVAFTVTATDVNGCAGSQAYTITFGVMGPGCIFCDDFNDTDFTNPLWSTQKGSWSATTGDLAATSTRRATSFSPDFGGCPGGVCSIYATVNIGTVGQGVSVLGWYVDRKNYVEVRLSTKGAILFKSKINKVTVAKRKVKTTINKGQDYLLKVTFDGNLFQVFLDNVQVLTDIPKGVDPSADGFVAFRVKTSTGSAVAGTMRDIQVLP